MTWPGDADVLLQEEALDDCESSAERDAPHDGPGGTGTARPGKRWLKLSALAILPALFCASALAWRYRSFLGPEAPGSALDGRPRESSREALVSAAISLVAKESKAKKNETSTSRDASRHGDGALPKYWEEVSVNSSAPISFFCFTVVVLGGIEEQLLTFQWGKKMGLFQCADWDVIANKRKQIGGEGSKGFETRPLPGGIHDKKGVVGVACSETPGYLNSWTFMNVWVLVIKQKRVWRHDFIIKTDVDAVFFPYRLPAHAQPHRGKAMLFSTCPNNKLWGSLEVFSRAALERYASRLHLADRKPDEPACPEECKKLTWWCWGEDEYMQRCMETLGAYSVFDQGLVQQGCNAGTCSDPRVAFHKYGEVWRQEQCLKLAGQR